MSKTKHTKHPIEAMENSQGRGISRAKIQKQREAEGEETCLWSYFSSQGTFWLQKQKHGGEAETLSSASGKP